ncbi:MAG: hypothetical protein R3E89_15690 [Thiolinea sp.]
MDWAAPLGPELGARLHDYFPLTPFAGAYLAIAALNIVFAPILLLLKIPLPTAPASRPALAVPLLTVLQRPAVMVAILCGMVSYALMSLVMTATPLAMQGCGFATEVAADVVRWHVIAMFAPEFFHRRPDPAFWHRADYCHRLLLLLAFCGVIALLDTELMNFYAALILLGLG